MVFTKKTHALLFASVIAIIAGVLADGSSEPADDAQLAAAPVDMGAGAAAIAPQAAPAFSEPAPSDEGSFDDDPSGGDWGQPMDAGAPMDNGQPDIEAPMGTEPEFNDPVGDGGF